jgi:tetratricopeptide (TPR) repeat protein
LALAKKEQFDLALQEFKAAGGEARAHYNLANQYYDQERYQEAKEHYQIALEHKPDMQDAQRRLEASEALARIAKEQVKVAAADSLTAQEVTEAKKKIMAMVEKAERQTATADEKVTRDGQIEISNGNGVTRMARLIAEFMKENNYKVVRLTNADNFNYKSSQIYYQKGYEETAAQINKDIPVSVRQDEVKSLDRPNIKVKLVIGKDVIPYKKNFSKQTG